VGAATIDAGWFALTQLTALTSLALGGKQQGRTFIAQELVPMAAALLRLQSLQLLHCPKLTRSAVLQLMQLTQLTSLEVAHYLDDAHRQIITLADLLLLDDALPLGAEGFKLSSKVSLCWLHGSLSRIPSKLNITEAQPSFSLL
jgi:hypothetical protein